MGIGSEGEITSVAWLACTATSTLPHLQYHERKASNYLVPRTDLSDIFIVFEADCSLSSDTFNLYVC